MNMNVMMDVHNKCFSIFLAPIQTQQFPFGIELGYKFPFEKDEASQDKARKEAKEMVAKLEEYFSQIDN